MTLSAEAEAIVRALAARDPRVDADMGMGAHATGCFFCGVLLDHAAHDSRCPWFRAVAWVRRADAEREGGK